MTIQLLFVCLGNICRSPSAENIMNHLLQSRQLADQITCDSAGTSSYHIGSAPDRRMAQAARAEGITLAGQARQLQAADLENFDWILAMDDDNYRDILRLDPDGRFHHKVRKICDFCRHHTDKEVPDPYYGGEAGFKYVIDLLLDACEGFLEFLLQESASSSV
ncbi:low molecular weight phosphotyrosine protein phosphatase [Oscillatoria sp. CS-180]|uniref:low molecular weight protein-tyrosine-phosphatase n=1 Tax=Oscillatoria sp. CS-180 TaxID=3021720 RepID=UPI00232D88D1|nr:low molecular weight protein-tyrosine-phosphatase [Oscillatoria sp. CS-180]MDB9528515.1 low molecular weight phosphotyrosine protein phosphatase [Oscillatoria sp. CS-180]